MALFYADENFPYPVSAALRAAGHDVLTVQQDGRGGQGIPDPRVLARAIQLGRAVLTTDRQDFIRLHSLVPAHAGIVACSQDKNHSALTARILAALAGVTDLTGQLVPVNLPARPRPPKP